MNFKRLRGRIGATAVACLSAASIAAPSVAHASAVDVLPTPEAHNNVMMQELPSTGPLPDVHSAGYGDPAKPWIVGLGDSYMSGEGAIWSNKNYFGYDRSLWTFHWTGGINQVYGDNNGQESIPYAHRSYSAPMHIGGDWNSKNLAVSGAEQPTLTAEGNRWKPGIDFNGQAAMLRDFAKDKDVRAVALSIGGNDFGFSDLASLCVRQYLIPRGGPAKDLPAAKRLNSQDNYNKVRSRVKTAAVNVSKAMEQAGKSPRQWKLLYQTPPMFISSAAHTQYSDRWGYDRQNYGGAGFLNDDLDWLNSEVAPNLRNAMIAGIRDAQAEMRGTQIVVIDNSDAFNYHRLADKATTQHSFYRNYIGMNPAYKIDNGKDGEWVTPLVLANQFVSDWHWKQNPFHPNYWGQRALSAGIEHGLYQPVRSLIIKVERDTGRELDSKGRPAMKITDSWDL